MFCPFNRSNEISYSDFDNMEKLKKVSGKKQKITYIQKYDSLQGMRSNKFFTGYFIKTKDINMSSNRCSDFNPNSN